MKLTYLLLLFPLAFSCSDPEPGSPVDCFDGCTHKPTQEQKLQDLESQMASLRNISSSIEALIYSDFASCSGVNVQDPLIQKMCNVAQASTVEARVELKTQLAAFSDALNNQLEALEEDIADLKNGNVPSIEAQIANISSTISSLQSQINTAASSISTLQSVVDNLVILTSSISGTLSGTVQEVLVGEGSSYGGPLFESLLRKADHSQILAYVSGESTYISLPSNPITTSAGSNLITVNKSSISFTATNSGSGLLINSASHGFANNDPVMFGSTGTLPSGLNINTVYYIKSATNDTFQVSLTKGGSSVVYVSAGSGTHRASLGVVAGDLVILEMLSSGRGITRGDLYGEKRVISSTVDSFTVSLNRSATSSGSIGGSIGVASKIVGRGLQVIWKSSDGQDTKVRQTSYGSVPTNLIISSTGEICYSASVPLEIFANLSAFSSGVICK
jgi:hypothetical protein